MAFWGRILTGMRGAESRHRQRRWPHDPCESGKRLRAGERPNGRERRSPARAPSRRRKPDGGTICLQDSRYQVRATWQSPEGEVLPARAAHAGTNDSGLLWFHGPENWEVLVKVLDGCSINGADWVFAASATTLRFDMEVTDTVTGEVRRYGNEAGRKADAETIAALVPRMASELERLTYEAERREDQKRCLPSRRLYDRPS